jgi:hypothetical protein
VELPEQASVVSVKLQDEGFVPRLLRQLVEAQVVIIFLACAHQFHLLTREMAELTEVPLQLCSPVRNGVLPINHPSRCTRQLDQPRPRSIRIPTAHRCGYRLWESVRD